MPQRRRLISVPMPRYQRVAFGRLMIGQPFKHSKTHGTWWKKTAEREASGLKGAPVIPMRADDLVWVDWSVWVADIGGTP